MPLAEEDEVFVEKCFQRSLIVRTAITHLILRLTSSTGIGKINIIQRDANRCMAADRRDLSRRRRVLHAHRVDEGRAPEREHQHHRGLGGRRPAQKVYL